MMNDDRYNGFGYLEDATEPGEIVSQKDPIKPFLEESDEIIDMDDDFDFDGFQVVRREFFAHQNEPAVTFNNCKIYVNSVCLKKFPQTDYVQVLINPETKVIALRPCTEFEKDSFAWCCESKGKRKPKQTTCKLFFGMLASQMEWNPDYRYKLIGKLMRSKGQYVIAFDLRAAGMYERIRIDGSRPKTSRKPIYPSDWKEQFGLPYKEHQQSMQIDIFDGYAIYSVKDTKNPVFVKAAGAEQVPQQEQFDLGGMADE